MLGFPAYRTAQVGKDSHTSKKPPKDIPICFICCDTPHHKERFHSFRPQQVVLVRLLDMEVAATNVALHLRFALSTLHCLRYRARCILNSVELVGNQSYIVQIPRDIFD